MLGFLGKEGYVWQLTVDLVALLIGMLVQHVYDSRATRMCTTTSPQQRCNNYGLVVNLFYNIPRACLLNRLPVPAMDLKSNRSGV